ncbi:hypothetical protein IAI10_16170 [Clostridium sp. 19966]|uniref:hypothetical protein n=1 Tax=Clostridium sp. 19966 TaxID=2768166 RepID=UPI0028DFF101|nr:hypothetical protein [Clostridium sp. 19966]MDT8718203.1 hypothetical protein [Clostridium sp. 19966]
MLRKAIISVLILTSLTVAGIQHNSSKISNNNISQKTYSSTVMFPQYEQDPPGW